MYCARCGSENPDDGKFCRSCGGRIGFVDGDPSDAERDVSDPENNPRQARLRSGSRKLIWGLFAIVASLFFGIPLKGSGYADLLLLPGMLLIVWAMSDFIRLRTGTYRSQSARKTKGAGSKNTVADALPPDRTVFAEDEVRPEYDTGEMVPHSVTEATTRELELEGDGETTKLERD